jgi:hypothetical protein
MSQHLSYKKQHVEERKRQRRLRKAAKQKAKRATVIFTPERATQSLLPQRAEVNHRTVPPE